MVLSFQFCINWLFACRLAWNPHTVIMLDDPFYAIQLKSEFLNDLP